MRTSTAFPHSAKRWARFTIIRSTPPPPNDGSTKAMRSLMSRPGVPLNGCRSPGSSNRPAKSVGELLDAPMPAVARRRLPPGACESNGQSPVCPQPLDRLDPGGQVVGGHEKTIPPLLDQLPNRRDIACDDRPSSRERLEQLEGADGFRVTQRRLVWQQDQVGTGVPMGDVAVGDRRHDPNAGSRGNSILLLADQRELG